MDPARYAALRDALAADVQARLARNDASHDWSHVDRVRRLALSLARESPPGTVDLHVVELGALLHDVADWKYTNDDAASAVCSAALLREHGATREEDAQLVARVLETVDGVSFSGEIAGPRVEALSLEAQLVQDADRLEAIGAIGIARCFTYGGAKHRPLHDPSIPPLEPSSLGKDAYRDPARVHTSINHFTEKLLTLQGRLKTPAGRRVGLQRHAFTAAFLEQFLAE